MVVQHEQSSPPVVFNFGTHSVRTIEQDGEVWFVAADVCQVLGIANPRHAVSRLDDDERGVVSSDTPSSNQHGSFGTVKQEVTTINESGLYSLILTSRKEEARAFKRWVTHEVLPAIRKTGRYESPEQAELSRIDPRELLLNGQSTPTVKVTTKVADAIEKKAWNLAREAFELSREHLQRRVAYAAERGHPRVLDERRAMQVIKDGDLGDALAHAYRDKLSGVRHAADYYLWSAQKLVNELAEAEAKLQNTSNPPEDQL